MPVAFAKLRPKALPIAVVLGAVVVGSGLAVASKSDIARFQGDAERIRALERAPFFPAGTVPTADRDWPQWRGPRRDGVSFDAAISFDWPPAVHRCAGKNPSAADSPPPSCATVASTPCFRMKSLAPSISLARESFAGMRTRARSDGDFATRAATRSEWALGRDRRRSWPTGSCTPWARRESSTVCADTGEKVWRHDLLEEFHGQRPRYGMSFSPLLDGELVFALPGGREGGSVAAFNVRTGQLVWQALDDEAGYSSPVCATLAGVRQLLVLTNEALVSLSPADGRIYWRYPWLTKDGFNIATPLTFDNYVFISSAYGKGCALLEVSANEEGQLNAKQVYAHNRMRNYFASSIQFGAHIYGFDNSDLICMEIRTGKVLWRERGFRKGSLVIANGHLIVLGENGRLAVARAIPGEYREIGAVQVSRNKCWTVPVLAGGNLYVRDENHLRCLNLRQ